MSDATATLARKMTGAAELRLAVEVFARGFAFTRSFTHPYLVERLGPLWALRDAPRRRPADYRREEYIALGVEPAEVDALARAHTRGRFCVSAIGPAGEPDGATRVAYKALGYRLGTTEPVMVHRLGRVPRVPEPFPIERVTTAALADRLAEAAGARQVLPKHLAEDSPLRQYVALDGGRPVGWVRSIRVFEHRAALGGGAAWVSNLFVQPAYRRRGVGRALLARLLRGDRGRGVVLSGLTASHSGALLYPLVGYQLIGTLLLFTPKRR